MEDGGKAGSLSSRPRRGRPSSSARPHRSASPIKSDTGGIRAVYSDVRRKLQEYYTFDLMPETFAVKFRQQVEGLQLGANFEVKGCNINDFHRLNTNDCHTKLVFKPASENHYWKVTCEPKQRDVRVLTKKIPLGSMLHLQFGIGHDFLRNSTGWNWKVTSVFGWPGSALVRQKTVLPIFPGFDVNVNWNAQYELPELHGASGTGESPVVVHYGRLHTKIDRVTAVYTHFG